MAIQNTKEANLHQVDPDTLRGCLLNNIRISRPSFVWGNPGIGKSDNVKSLVKHFESEGKKALLIDIRASQMDAVDTRGVPYTYVVTGETDVDFEAAKKEVRRTGWAMPDCFPTPEQAAQFDIIIIFLDELNNAPLSVQAALYQLVLDRQLGDYKLPDNVKILAAGNLETDRGATQRMATPLADRFFHFELIVDGDSWERWALDSDIHLACILYRRLKPEHLHQFDPKSRSKAQPSPRGWEYVSDAIKDCEEHGVNGKVQLALIAGKLGEAVGSEFSGFLKIYRTMPDPDAIILNPESAPIASDPATNIAICGALANKSSEDNVERVLKYGRRLAASPNAGDEFMTLLVRTIAAKKPECITTHAFITWASENPEVLIGC
jgi:hypothetical protein